jgi:hypothetical protein
LEISRVYEWLKQNLDMFVGSLFLSQHPPNFAMSTPSPLPVQKIKEIKNKKPYLSLPTLTVSSFTREFGKSYI